jgi:MFS family permease
MTAQLAFGTFCVTMCSSTYSGALPYMMKDLKMGQEVGLLGLSVYVAGFGLGPLLFAPLSEVTINTLCYYYGSLTSFNI